MLDSTQPDPTMATSPRLPVLIAGAGPCGLVAATTLKKEGIPFVILEKVSRQRICSNAGSGFELAPTAVAILEEGLCLDLEKTRLVSRYRGMCLATMEGRPLRTDRLGEGYVGGSLNRAELQRFLLGVLFSSPKDEEGVLVCGSGVESYRETKNRTVVVELASGKEFEGCALLACDGIRSRCRDRMMGDLSREDSLHYCKAVCYWGKTLAREGTALEKEFLSLQSEAPRTKKAKARTKTKTETQTLSAKAHAQEEPGLALALEDHRRSSFVLSLATPRVPAVLFVIPSQHTEGGETTSTSNTKSKTALMLNWGITVASKNEPAARGDSTRRGGGVLSEDEKKQLLSLGGKKETPKKRWGGATKTKAKTTNRSLLANIEDFPLLEELLAATPAKDITEAGFYDRKDLDLPYTSEGKLVALLGDAAHPQTPYLGQGVNMAITDAYIYSSAIADALQKSRNKSSTTTTTETEAASVADAIRWCDPDFRRRDNKSAVRWARFLCDFSSSSNRIVCWLFHAYCKHIVSPEEFLSTIEKTDRSNARYWKYFVERYGTRFFSGIKNPDQKKIANGEIKPLREEAEC
ncbi:unnamed protein product [Pseudo-nitzschia multistriata]|uniref:FAD-binding domain-containing protein n=1 Tax=Pseudo-nitzschia multistriata TaxID=183589 RepID=A0A448ZPC2_9STRA|nr:unnamed protein product [Pseudo-nitzschia multistriata]